MAGATRYAFSVDGWHRMGKATLFDEDARIEQISVHDVLGPA